MTKPALDTWKVYLGLALSILATGFVLLGCSPPQASRPVITTISGQVLDGVTNEPVQNATVSNDQNEEQVLTNSQGEYTIRVDVEVGKQYRIIVTKDRYEQNTVTLMAREGEGRTADVVLMPWPELGVSADSVRFDATENQRILIVKNEGGGTLNWEATPAEDWLTVEPISEPLNRGASLSVRVTVNRWKVGANGTYTSEVIFTSAKGGSTAVTVTMVVEGKEPPPEDTTGVIVIDVPWR